MKLADLKLNPDNPRNISEEKLDKLAESIKSFPKMMVKRPIVYDENKVIIGGNMRYRAIQKLGMELDPKYVDVIRKRYWKFVNGDESGWEAVTPAIKGE